MQHAAACSDRTQPSRRVLAGDIARIHGAALRASHALSFEQDRVLRCLERCRTGPTCQSLEQHRWLERRRETILPVPYFHLVFTLPSELRTIVAMNRERMFGVMFEAASKTVLALRAAVPTRLSRWLFLSSDAALVRVQAAIHALLPSRTPRADAPHRRHASARTPPTAISP